MSDDLLTQIAAEKFVSLTTFRRDGSAIATPMWIIRDGTALVAWTPADSGKVTRLHRDPRVELSPCGRTGKVAADAPVLRGTAEVLTEAATVSHAAALIKDKYGLEFRIVTVAEAVLARGRKPRVALRISTAA
ncbi:MAG: PPOX class F420-dependent oxidoreductase [Mycobacterium sp.]